MENQTKQPGLYSEQFEHDNCGIGAIVSIKGIKTHQTVSDALSTEQEKMQKERPVMVLVFCYRYHISSLKRL